MDRRTPPALFLFLILTSILFFSGGCVRSGSPETFSAKNQINDMEQELPNPILDAWHENIQELPKSPNGINYIFERLTTENGLSHNNIHTIFQDSYGFLWIGTSDGLNRFDGYHFEIFRDVSGERNSLRGNNVWAIHEDTDRNLWIGTDNGLNFYNRQTGEFSCFSSNPDDPQTISSDQVRSIIEDSQGDLWIGTWGGGLNHFDRQQGVFERFMFDVEKPGSLSDNFVKTIYQDSMGLIWIATSNGLNRFDPRSARFIIFQRTGGSSGDFSEYELEMLYEGDTTFFWSGKPSPLDVDIKEENPTLLSNNQVQAIIEGTDRQLWIGTANGLDCLNLTTGRFDHYSHDANDINSLGSDMVLSLFFDKNGTLWVGTSNGLNVFNEANGTFTHYVHNSDDPSNSHFLGNQVVNTIFQDRSGAYWLGTTGGINRFDQTTSLFIHNYHDPDKPSTLSGNMVWSFAEDSNIGFWVGSSVGLDRYDTRRGTFTPYVFSTPDGKIQEAIQVYSVFKDSSAFVWAGTSKGLYRYDPEVKEFVLYQPVDGDQDQDLSYLEETIILDVVESPRGTLWLGTYGDGLLKLDLESGQVISYAFDQDDPQSVSSNIVSVLLVDHEDRLYIGTRGGGVNLYLPDIDAFRRYISDPNDLESLSENNITDMMQSSSGEIWIATMSGLNRFDQQEERFEVFSNADGLASDVVYGILEDAQGRFWVSTNNGITRFYPDKLDFRTFTFKNGLQANEFNQGAALTSIDGLLFFGGVNGFTVFDPALLAENPYRAPVLVTAMSQSGEEINLPGLANLNMKIDLEWPKNYFEFNAAVLNYIQRDENTIQYRLAPMEEEWQMLEPYQTASYENLSGGQYTLWLRGANNDGLWSDAVQVMRINVTPPFWESRWFRFAGAFFAFLVILLAVQMRVKSMRKYSHLLESEVEERTADIEKRRVVAEGLREVLIRINSDRTIEDSLDFVACQTNRLLHTRMTLIFKMDEGVDPEIVAYADSMEPSQTGSVSRHVIQAEVLGWAKKVPHSRRVFRTRFDCGPTYSPREGKFDFLVAPVYSMNRALGALVVLEDEKNIMNDEDLDLLQSLADQAGLAMENANLRENAEGMAVIAERNRIARDLHDAITQTLFSANLIAESLPQVMRKNVEEGTRNLRDLQKLNKGALSEMRTLLLELRPNVIPDIKLEDLIRQVAEAVEGRAGLHVEMDIKEAARLPEKVHLQFYRIAQEAVANIIKHAQAEKMSVAFRSKSYRRSGQSYLKARLLIEDDGVGFEPDCDPGYSFRTA